MKFLLLAFARFFAAAPWSALTALVGVSLGVASTVAVHLISLGVVDALRANTPSHLRQATRIAERAGADMSDYFDLRRRWRNGRLPGVELVTPVVEGQLVAGGRRLQVIGTDWFAQGSEGGASFVRHGVVADSSLGYGLNERFELGGERWTVVAVVDAGLNNGLLLDIGDALALLGRPPDALSFVAVRLSDPLAGLRNLVERLLPGMSAGLPFSGPGSVQSLADWELHPVKSALPQQQFAEAILFNLGALGLLALLVAWFLIHQVSVLWLRRQDLLLRRLAAIGASRSELAGCFLLSLTAFGAIAAMVGLVGGHWLADLLVHLSTAGLGALPAADLSAIVVAKALVSGILVSLAGAWLAFSKHQASLADVSSRPAVPGKARRFWVVITIGTALAAIGLGFSQTGLYGAFAVILIAGLITVTLVTPLLRLLRRWLARSQRGLLTRLALRQAVWSEAELSTALGALVLAVGASVGIGLMVGSFEADFARMLKQRLAHEHYLELPGQDAAELAKALHQAHPQAQVQAYGRQSTRLRGQAVEIGHTDFSAVEAARYGYPLALKEDEALASESLLLALGLAVGETLDWQGAPLRIVHAFPGFGESRPRLLLDNAAAGRLAPPLFDRISVSGIADADLERWLNGRAPGVQVRHRAAMRALALDVFDKTFAITRALTVLALFVAVVGLYNAMMALRLNQRASAALLRTLGMNATELSRMALIRASILGLVAVSLALPLGLFIGYVLCAVVNPRAFGWTVELSVSVADWALPALLGFGAALAAGLIPAPAERVGVH